MVSLMYILFFCVAVVGSSVLLLCVPFLLVLIVPLAICMILFLVKIKAVNPT